MPLAAQLDEDYAPLHEATRQALTRPRDAAVRQATIELAAKMLANANPRRREDASYILGHLRSDAALDQHIALLQWDAKDPKKSDWPTIAQAAESLGLIPDGRALPGLMALVKSAPEALGDMKRPQRDFMTLAMAHALLSAGRLRHSPALAEAHRILQFDPANCPGKIRAAAAFAVGVLETPATQRSASKFLQIYDSQYEDHVTKFESLKALGNLRHAPSADRLKEIAETDATPDLRWIAHWAYERAAGVHVPYTPPTERRDLPVTILDLAKD
jgi:HEAT repeat protein